MELIWTGVVVLCASLAAAAVIIRLAVTEWHEAVEERRAAVAAYDQAAGHLREALELIDAEQASRSTGSGDA